MSLTFNSTVLDVLFWTDFKSLVINSKSLSIQYETDTQSSLEKYIIFALDGEITYICNIWLSTVPTDILSSYSQAQNDADRADFEANYLPGANSRLSPGLVQTTVLENFTVTSGGSQTFSGLSNRQISLFINCSQAATGISPGIQFTLQEVDPGDLTTAVGTSITGASITSFPQTQEITLNLTTSSAIKVSWIIVGSSSPTFPGTYATLTSKPTTVFSGVDAGGVERVFQPDTSGRLLVSGSNAVNSAATVNPIIIGGVNPAGFVGYSQLASDDSLVVTDGGNTQPVFINGTINSSSISNLTNIGDGSVYLFINVKNAPTGTNPTLTFKLQEMDPGDKSTALRTSVTGAAITAAGTQVLVLPMVSSGVVQVQWTIGGTNSPTFTGVYVTSICKPPPDDVYGDFYPSATNSMIYEASTATAGVAPGTVIGTTAAFTLYNPKTSTRNLVVQEIGMAYASGTLGSGAVFLCANTNPAAAAVTGTSITPVSTLIGGTVAAQGQAFTTATLPASPTIVKALWTLTPMLATSVFQPFSLEEMAYGKYVILPGCSLSLEAVAGAGTSPKVTFNMTWVEVPF